MKSSGPVPSIPATPIYAHAYDAFGYFIFLQQHGVDVWSKLATLSVDNGAAFTELDGTADVLQDWGAGFFRDSTLGEEWDMTGPGITDVRPDAASSAVDLGNGDITDLKVPATSVGLALINAHADLVTVTSTGIGHVRLGDGTDVDQNGSAVYCTRTDNCVCPPDSAAPSPVTVRLPEGPIRVAQTAGTTPTETILSGQALDCTTPSPVGQWSLVCISTSTSGGSAGTSSLTGGTAILNISSDGHTTLDYADAVLTGTVTSKTGLAEIEVAANGHAETTLKFDPVNSLVSMSGGTGGFTATSHGVPLPLPGGYGFPDGTVAFPYECMKKTMIWTKSAGTVTTTQIWSRN